MSVEASMEQWKKILVTMLADGRYKGTQPEDETEIFTDAAVLD